MWDVRLLKGGSSTTMNNWQYIFFLIKNLLLWMGNSLRFNVSVFTWKHVFRLLTSAQTLRLPNSSDHLYGDCFKSSCPLFLLNIFLHTTSRGYKKLWVPTNLKHRRATQSPMTPPPYPRPDETPRNRRNRRAPLPLGLGQTQTRKGDDDVATQRREIESSVGVGCCFCASCRR